MIRIQTSRGQYYCFDSETSEIIPGFRENDGPEVRTVRFPEVKHQFVRFDTLIFNITEACNLRCRYCCYSGDYRNTRKHNSSTLSFVHIDSALHLLLENMQSEQVLIGFYGGECLLHFDRIRYVVEQAEKLFGESVSFFMTTNGTLLSKIVSDFLFEHRVLVNVSLDGTDAFNDENRVYPDGKGSFGIVCKNLSYIKDQFQEKWDDSVHFMMTLPERDRLIPIAESWARHPLLRDKAPVQISALAPNYEQGVELINEKDSKAFLLKVLDMYEKYPEYIVLKAYLEGLTREWYERPIYPSDAPFVLSACVPNNRKLFVDSHGFIGICEKMPDAFRIGSLDGGIDWKKVESFAEVMMVKRKGRCESCEFLRMCDICPTSIDLTEQEMNIFCYNQKVGLRLQLWLFCELAERGLIYG